jgi:hypothetical protein
MFDELDYGEPIPGVLCPACGGELVRTHSGAYCDWCSALVPVVGEVVVIEHDEDQDEDWNDE